MFHFQHVPTMRCFKQCFISMEWHPPATLQAPSWAKQSNWSPAALPREALAGCFSRKGPKQQKLIAEKKKWTCWKLV